MVTDKTGMFGIKKDDDDLTSGYNMSFAGNTEPAPLALLAQQVASSNA